MVTVGKRTILQKQLGDYFFDQYKMKQHQQQKRNYITTYIPEVQIHGIMDFCFHI